MRFKQHETKQNMKVASSMFLIFSVIGFLASVIFFTQNEFMNGLIFLSIMIMMAIFTKQTDDDLNKRSLEEFICKMNGKKWEDYCSCEKCKAQQTFHNESSNLDNVGGK